MKIILLSISLTIISMVCYGQTFQGMVMYKNTYKSKIPSLTDQQLTLMMGDTQKWFIKAGSYKSESNGTFMKWQLYINNKDNKIYNKMSSSEAVLYSDASSNDDSVISVHIKKHALVVLGYECDELVLTAKSGIQKYYFTSKLGINSKLFINHNFGNWYKYLQTTNAVSLKMIIETPQLTMESIAIKIDKSVLNAKFFELPEHTQIKKMPNQ